MNASYLLTQFGFVVLTSVSFALFFRAMKKSLALTSFSAERKNKIFTRGLLLLIGWAVATSMLSIMGVFSDFSTPPPRLFFVLPIPLILLVVIMNVKSTTEILRHTPTHALIQLQAFRVFVELLLWALFTQNLLPVQMTFEGRNFDILIGLTAPLIAWLYQHQKISSAVAIIWNIVGIIMLLNIVTIAILSMPTPFRIFMNEPANTVVTKFPIVWLPMLLVPLAYWLHLLSLKQLIQSKTSVSVSR